MPLAMEVLSAVVRSAQRAKKAQPIERIIEAHCVASPQRLPLANVHFWP